MFINFREDCKRYKKSVGFVLFEPSIVVVFIYRVRKFLYFNRFFKPLKYIYAILLEPIYLIITVFFGIQLPKKCEIGPGLVIHHFGGVILNPNTKIGKNCTLRHNVTIGNRKTIDDVPVLGDNVDIGTGAVIIGKIKIGNNVKIGANAVVLIDVPDNSVVVGNPARVINKKI